MRSGHPVELPAGAGNPFSPVGVLRESHEDPTMRTLVTFALAACVLASCRSDVRTVAAASPSSLTPTPVELFPPTSALLPQGTRIIIQSANLSLTVDDPAKALAQIEGAVMELGGFVASSNSWSSPGSPASSSLSARVPRDSLPALRRVAIGLSNQIQSDGTYSQDVTADHRQLHVRLQVVGACRRPPPATPDPRLRPRASRFAPDRPPDDRAGENQYRGPARRV